MTKSKYEVIRPWFGVGMGQIVEFDKVPNALLANVRPVTSRGISEAGEAAGIVAQAEAKRDQIIADANAQADAIVAEAHAAANPGGELTPATPDATADKPKSTKPK